MISTRRDNSKQLPKRVVPTCPKKTNYDSHRGNNQLRSRGKGSSNLRRSNDVDDAWKLTKKSAAIFPESEEYGVDDQFDFEKWSGEGDCMWLFSDIKPPSLTCEDHLGTERLSFRLSISRNSVLSSINEISFFDGSRTDPIDEASLLLEKMSNLTIVRKNLEQVVPWQLSSSWNGMKEMSESSDEHSCYENSSDCESSWMSLSTDDASSGIWELDKMDACDPLIDIRTGWDVFQSEFPSPSYMRRCYSLVGSSDSNVSTLHEENQNSLSSDLLSEDVLQAAECDNDEPLFRPPESKFSWNSEVLFDCFCMSPRRVGSELGKCERFSAPKSVILRLQSRKFRDQKEEFSSSRSQVPTTFCSKIKHEKKNMRRTSNMPSKLRISVQDSTEKRPLEIRDDLDEPTRENIANDVLITDYRELLEDCFLSIKDVPIETLVGLDEFNGHEGVNGNFDENSFSLDEL
ncbi:hypothetical protein IFM89_007566 [Coptis chinensis]|uniref:Uncharacterized protein n=1 Tax=Coptis chinensis TaxID=261450 RepID=A0A835HWD5_9MAGN|nr:hypothetical protein IFM89_007566 [Coptis chinensis]